MAETLPGTNHNQCYKDEGRDAGYACRDGIPIAHVHALPHERSFSSKISDQLDRDCEPANNFGVLWKVRSWQILLQKSAVTDDVRSPSSFRAMGFAPDPDAPTQLLRYAIHSA